MQLAKLVIHHARAREFDPAIAFPGGIATYGTLGRAVWCVGEQLDRVRLNRGDVVALDIRNPFHHVALVLALELRGIASAAVQTGFSLAHSGISPAVVLVDGLTEHDGAVPVVRVDQNWFITNPKSPIPYDSMLGLPGFPDPDALVRVVFSSGTTGVPKATGLSSRIIEQRIFHNQCIMLMGARRLVTMMGPSTLPGYMLPMTMLTCGGMICYAGLPQDALQLVRSLSIDLIFSSAAQLRALVGALGDARPPDLKQIVTIGSRLPTELLTQVQSRLCANVTMAYGTTETGAIAYAPASLLRQRDGVAGHKLPWVDLQVVDRGDNCVTCGEEGILRLKTTELAPHLIRTGEESDGARDGWYYPGDVGRLHADGLVEITGRVDDVINHGGSIVAPELIESVLLSYPGVLEAAAFGMPDEIGMEKICAAVVFQGEGSEQELLRFCRTRLADKAPRVIRTVDKIPRTESGKIRRQQLAAESAI